MPDLPPHLHLRRAAELGRDSEVTRRAIDVSQRLRGQGAAPVLTLGHLAHLTGAPSGYLRAIASRALDPYLAIDRPKRDGRTRPIASPEPVLMDVQRWVLKNVLVACRTHYASWAYRPGRSIVGCATQHIGARWLVKLDLHDFFHSVDERAAFATFVKIGYPRLISFELSRLCTRTTTEDRGWRHGRKPYLAMPYGVLPQGAPTSGALANAAMFDVDAELASLAHDRGLVYTRYSDDLVFSTGVGWNRDAAADVVNRATAVLGRGGFRVHRRKTAIVPPGARKIVLGMLVLDDRVILLSEFKRRLEVHIRGVAKFGLIDHARHRGFRSVLSMVEHIDGCIAFAHSAEPEFAAKASARWEEALQANGFPRRR